MTISRAATSKLLSTAKSNSTFTRYPIDVTQLVTTATVALVGAVDIGTLLAARVGVTLIDICQNTGTDTTCFFTTLPAFRGTVHHTAPT